MIKNENDVCCGYCCKPHKSSECQEVSPESHKDHHCVNCRENGKEEIGHSSMWRKCPAYMEMQSKLKKTIPYYEKKNGI